MKPLTLNEWLSLLANVGVILGLIFLGLELRQNNLLIEMESRNNISGQVNSVVEMTIQEPVLIELLGKDESELTVAERDRLILLGMLMLQAFQTQFVIAEAGISGDLESQKNIWSAIYNRPRLNYGIPLAWEVYAARDRSDFVIWFEENIIGRQ